MDKLLDKDSVQRVKISLENFNSSIKVQILKKSARTALDASKALGCEVGAIVKSLLIRTDETFILCLVSGDKKCSLNKLKKITGKKNVCMANAESVKNITGFTIGGVSPIGLKKDLEVMIDKQFNRFNNIYAAAGHPNAIFKIDLNNLINITKGSMEDISE
tara:strand:+ start:727 stop:1209 length:483 start_codon:yes stop_codon:yes gene_type:complete